MYVDFIGYIGSIFLAACGLPQAYMSFKYKNSNGISFLFILLWLIGEYLTLSYVLLKHIRSIPLLVNYIVSVFSVSIIMYYKIKDMVSSRCSDTSRSNCERKHQTQVSNIKSVIFDEPVLLLRVDPRPSEYTLDEWAVKTMQRSDCERIK